MSVFIIINEWTDRDGNVSSEPVAATYFTTENEAHESLGYIAEAHDVELSPLDTSFVTENDPHLQFQEYYIQELTRG